MCSSDLFPSHDIPGGYVKNGELLILIVNGFVLIRSVLLLFLKYLLKSFYLLVSFRKFVRISKPSQSAMFSILLKQVLMKMKDKNKGFEGRLLDLQNNMMNFALALTTNKDEAKDLLQETTLRALGNKEKYYENVNFKGWVFTIMHNIFVNNYRRIVRSQTIIDQTDNLYYIKAPLS